MDAMAAAEVHLAVSRPLAFAIFALLAGLDQCGLEATKTFAMPVSPYRIMLSILSTKNTSKSTKMMDMILITFF
jgi:hypothetical protein